MRSFSFAAVLVALVASAALASAAPAAASSGASGFGGVTSNVAVGGRTGVDTPLLDAALLAALLGNVAVPTPTATSTATALPTNTPTPTATAAPRTCAAGTYFVAPDTCDVCTAGFYCTGGVGAAAVQTKCPGMTTSDPGAKGVFDCKAMPN